MIQIITKTSQLITRIVQIALVAGLPQIASAVSFSAGSATVVPGATATVPVTVSGFSQVLNFQFTVQWDPSVLEYVSSGSSGLSGVSGNLFSSSKLIVAWDGGDANAENGVTIADGTTAFTIQFRAVGSNGSSSSVGFTDSPTPKEALVKVGTSLVTQTPGTSGGSVSVSKPKPTITWSNPAAITYGTALSTTQLNATASVNGQYSYTPSSGTVLNTGNQTLNVTFTPDDTAAYDNNTATVTITVNKATPTLTWSNPSDIGYGTALSGTQLNATTSVSGTYSYSPASGTVLNVGTSQTLSVTFTPTDSANYNTATASVTINVSKGTPAITWSNPAAITYGAALSGTQLNASANVPGTFVYSPASGTVPNAGNQTLAVGFTPTDTANYNSVSANVTLTVNKATPTVSWSNPAAITYGAALSGTQLNATASVQGSFVYLPASGTVLNAGNSQSLSVTFTPNDTANYNNATANVTLTVNKATPTVTWSNPADITYGTALGGTQLSATASVQGSFVYSPASSTVLGVGNNQALSATFSPSDTANYNAASATVYINVQKVNVTLTWPTPSAITYGTALGTGQLNATANIPGTFAYSPAAATVLNAGNQTLNVTFTPTDTANYSAATANVTLTVQKATPTVTWSNPAAITYGTALGTGQLNATASVQGTFAYSPGAGTLPGAGNQNLSVTFTPTDAANYNNATANVTLTVNKATPTISWSNPAAITYGIVLSGTQLNATASVQGSFVYSPASGTVLNAGNGQSLSMTFTPNDTANYNNATASVSLTVNKATPIVTWSNPADITYGTALGAAQLNATASVQGTFAYSPQSGAVLSVGNSQALSATFIPTDTANYNNATAGVSINVLKVPVQVSWSNPSAITFGTALGADQLNATANVPGTFTYSPQAGTVLNAGSQTLAVTFAPTDTANYASTTANVTVTVNKATPTVNWGTPGAITYGTALSDTQLNATASVQGTFAYSPTVGAIPSAGNQTLSVTFTPSDAANYNTATANVTLTVNRATPAVTWSSPTAITYGTPLGGSQLNATANVQGTFAYSPGAGTIPSAGSPTLSVTFTPSDAANYSSATASVTLTVAKATPPITWSNPAPIGYGTVLGPTQLNATASVPGTFAYTPASGVALSLGNGQTLSVTFTPTDAANYSPATASVTIDVQKGTPVITWPTPSSIVYGTSLSANQLSATANVQGSFTYSPTAGTVLNAGSQTLAVTFTPNDAVNYNSASTSVSITVLKADQSISFAPLGEKRVGDPPFSAIASASSGLSVSFSASGPATVSGNTVTITGAGTGTIRAFQSGDENYNAAPDVNQTFTVGKLAQTISFGALSNRTYGDSSFPVNATATSGLPVSFSVLSGPAAFSANTVTITGAGTVTIRASQVGNDSYSAAASVDQSFNVAKASQTISFGTLSDHALTDPPFTLSATASSGLAVSFSIVTGPATISGNTVTLTGQGGVAVRASQDGNENYNAASSVTQIFAAGKGNQTISFGPLTAKTFGDPPFSLSATASSGLAVSFTVVSGPATVSGNTVNMTGAGTVVVRASQNGNDSFNVAPSVEQAVVVAKASQTITFSPLTDRALGDPPFTLGATASSGLPVSFTIAVGPATVSGNTVTMTGLGVVVVRASQTGNENYNAAPTINQIFTVTKGSQTITFGPMSAKTFGDLPFAVSATASSGLPVTFTVVTGPATIVGNTVTIAGTGTVSVRASQSGNDNYNAAPNADQSFVVAKANQTITLGSLPQTVALNTPFTLTATASSGLPVSLGLVSGPATIAGNIVTATEAGAITVRVSQPGNENFNPAPNVEQLLTVGKANQNIIFEALVNKVFGDAPFSIQATAGSGLPVNFIVTSGPATMTGNTVAITGAGTVTIRASQAGNENNNPAPDVDRSFTVAKANQTITFDALVNKVFGDAPFSIQATPSSGLPVSFTVASGPATITGNTVTITGAGTVAIRASQAGNENTNPAPDVDRSFAVAKARQTIVFGPLGNKKPGDLPFVVNAKVSSGLPVSFIIVSGPATITGNTVTLTGTGTVIVRAVQAGSENFEPAVDVDQSFVVENAAPTVSAISNQTAREGIPTGAIVFTVVDPDGPVADLKVSATSSNPNLVPTANIVLGGQGANRTVTLTPAPNQAGIATITIQVEDAAGGKATTTFELVVTAVPPTITKQPESRTVIAGANVTLVVTASGRGPLTYQWRFNGGDISGATNPSLVLNNVSLSQAGEYSAVVSNAGGSVTSAVVVVQVNVPVTITKQPGNQSVAAGVSVTFSVDATGTAPLRYQWQFNGADLAGQTNPTLQINNITPANAGEYSVLVINAAGPVLSARAKLEVATPPTITRQPQSQSVLVGTSVALSVAVSGTEPLRYQWRRNNTDVTAATGPTFSFSNVSTANGGEYTVIVSNSAGSVTSESVRLTVTQPVQITAQPTSRTVAVGQSATFSVAAAGTGPLAYQWRRNGVDLPGANQATLALSNVQSVQAGNYQVIVSNAAGPLMSAAATLTVNVPVSIIEQPQGRTVSEGDRAELTVVAAGTAPRSYQWQKNGANLAGATGSSLTISSTRAIDAGNYRVVVSNVVGSVNSADALVRVIVPPTIQIQPVSQNVAPGANVTFSIQANGDAPLAYQWKKNGENIASATGSSLALNNVQVAEAGNYSVVVANAGGAVTSAGATLTLILQQETGGPSAQQAHVLGEVLEATFDGGSIDMGGVGLQGRRNVPPATSGERWFSWKAPSTGIATFNTIGSTFDTVLTIYTGTTPNLTEVVRDDDRGGFFASQASFNAVQGTTYLINVKGFGGATGRIVVGFKLTPTAQKLPVLVAQPQSQTKPEGTDVTFNVQAEGTALRYQWYFNGRPLPGATSASLAVPGVIDLDVGNFAVRVSSGPDVSALTVESAAAALQVGTETTSAQDKFKNAPRLGGTGARLASYGLESLLQPVPDFVARQFAGWLSFSTVGSGKEQGEPNHADDPGGASQWFMYQAPASGVLRLSTDGSDFDTVLAVYSGSGSDFSSLKVEASDDNSGADGRDSAVNVTVAQGAVYYVAVDGAKGASGQAKLSYDLGQGPAISRQPASQSVAIGASVGFFVETTNALSGITTSLPILRYQWTRDGLKIGGETNRSLAIVNAQTTDMGDYAVIVSSFAGATTSAVARLTVNVPLTITSQPQSQNGQVGGKVGFAVTVSGSEPITYQWRANGTDLPGATNSSYVISSIQSATGGSYTVIARNAIGTVQSSVATLTVGQTPTITQQPIGTTATVGQRVVLSVTAAGIGTLRYQWRFNGVNIPGTSDPSLELTSVQLSDAGDYTVEVSNESGFVISTPARLAVNLLPRFIIQPLSQTVAAGNSVMFSALATGSGILTYQWSFNGREIPGATNAAYTISNAQAANSGKYSVVAQNATGTIESDPATLEVQSIGPEQQVFSDLRYDPASGFQFLFNVPDGKKGTVQTSLDFLNWVNLTTTPVTGSVTISDPQAVNFGSRFYRAVIENGSN